MSLYAVQKVLYRLNREPALQAAYRDHPATALDDGRLTDEERAALSEGDIGLLYHFGVNGQILMHFAAFLGVEWTDYLERLRQGVAEHGQPREGVYATTGYEGTGAHDEALRRRRAGEPA